MSDIEHRMFAAANAIYIDHEEGAKARENLLQEGGHAITRLRTALAAAEGERDEIAASLKWHREKLSLAYDVVAERDQARVEIQSLQSTIRTITASAVVVEAHRDHLSRRVADGEKAHKQCRRYFDDPSAKRREEALAALTAYEAGRGVG